MSTQLKGTFIPFVFLISCILLACGGGDYSPKPRGYHKITFPEKEYIKFDSTCPFTFDYPKYAKVVPDQSKNTEPCWINVEFPEFDAKLHLSYKSVNNGARFYALAEDSRRFVFKHTVKADGIGENMIQDTARDVYGIYYTIAGNAASNIQFFLTDTNTHFLRGALYFNSAPQIDSIKPVLEFIKSDIEVLMESLEWRD